MKQFLTAMFELRPSRRKAAGAQKAGRAIKPKPLGVPSMRLLSSTDLAISLASKRGTLRLVERASRFGDTFIAIEDHVGLIEVQATRADAAHRVRACCA